MGFEVDKVGQLTILGDDEEHKPHSQNSYTLGVNALPEDLSEILFDVLTLQGNQSLLCPVLDEKEEQQNCEVNPAEYPHDEKTVDFVFCQETPEHYHQSAAEILYHQDIEQLQIVGFLLVNFALLFEAAQFFDYQQNPKPEKDNQNNQNLKGHVAPRFLLNKKMKQNQKTADDNQGNLEVLKLMNDQIGQQAKEDPQVIRAELYGAIKLTLLRAEIIVTLLQVEDGDSFNVVQAVNEGDYHQEQIKEV